jgi:hypothetical protein
MKTETASEAENCLCPLHTKSQLQHDLKQFNQTCIKSHTGYLCGNQLPHGKEGDRTSAGTGSTYNTRTAHLLANCPLLRKNISWCDHHTVSVTVRDCDCHLRLNQLSDLQ